MVNTLPVHSTQIHDMAWNGLNLSDGLSKDSYITFTRNSESVMSASDAGGTSRSRSIIGDTSGTVELTLLQQHPVNIALSEVLASQENGGGLVEGDFRINMGGTLFLFQPKQACISKPPEVSLSTDISEGTNTWTFDAADMRFSRLDEYSINDGLSISIQADIDVVLTTNI